MFTIEPPHPGWWQIIWKTMIWLLTWVLISFLVFVIISALGSDFFTSWATLFLAMVFMLVACIVTIIGTAIIAGTLNIVFGSDYYDFWKMLWFSVLANGILVLLFAPVYLTLSGSVNTLLLVLAFHIIFWFFISYSLIEFTTNANYAWSSLIGTLFGFGLTMMTYLLVYNMTPHDDSMGNTIYVLMLLPFIMSYTVIPLCHGIWSGIYYGIFSGGSNPFYIAPLNEIGQATEEDNTVNVQL